MIDLQPFCLTDSFRPDLHTPFAQGGSVYATNGHIAVEVADRPGVAQNDSIGVPALFSKHWTGYNLVPAAMLHLPEIPPAGDDDCRACDGTGLEHPSCPHCDCMCEHCGGTGTEEVPRSICVAGGIFNADYIALLLTLPGLKLSKQAPKGNNPVPFSFDGGRGLIMPMVTPYEHHIGPLPQ